MKLRTAFSLISLVAMTGTIHAQDLQRRASIRGGGNGDSGKCTIEVVVDGTAQVEVRGDSAVLRNVKGQPPQWRRFECSSPMPGNPTNFRFQGVDGRGRQDLVRDPRQGGAAVVQIDDPDNGAEGYTFDLTWGGGAGQFTNNGGRDFPNQGGGAGQYPNRGGRDFPVEANRDRRFTTDQAVQVCQDSVRQQASNQFRTNDVTFRRTTIDDNPGRGDWVIGTIEVRRRDRPDQIAKFSCSVNFDTGRVRSAQIDPLYTENRGPGFEQNGRGQYPVEGPRRASAAALQNCQRSVEERVRRDGFDRVTFGSIKVDDRPGRNDWVVGDFRAVGRYGPESFQFSCSVDLQDGDVRSVDVTTRQ